MSSHGQARVGAGTPPAELLELLRTDRVWCAYALADLEPERAASALWVLGERAAAVVFRGLNPPWLTIHGDPEETETLAAALPPGSYGFALMATHKARLSGLQAAAETNMWRMALQPREFTGTGDGAERLGPHHAGELEGLFADHPDRPDAFDASQLEEGVFYGVRQADRLVAVSGTHVVGRREGVAAIGNVFTHPDHRRRGHARAGGAAVAAELLATGIGVIVLNVAMANEPALELYRSLGFWPVCGYYEGVGQLTPP